RWLCDLVDARIQALDEETRRLLGLAAIAGMDIRFRLLRTAAEAALERPLSEPMLLHMLDSACQARVLDDRDGEYVFRHPFIREVLTQSLSHARRWHYHATLARVMEEQWPEAAERLAHHYSRCGEHSKAALYLEQTGDRAQAMQASEAAEGYYRQLVDRFDTLMRPVDAARAREKLSDALMRLARYDEALLVVSQAAAAYRTAGDAEALARIVPQAGRLYLNARRVEEGINHLQSALATLGSDAAPSALGAIYATLAHLFLESDRYGDALYAAERAHCLGRVAGDDRTVALADVARGWSLLRLGRIEEGSGTLEGAVVLAETMGCLDMVTTGLDGLAAVCEATGDSERAREHLLRGLAVAGQVGYPATVARMSYRLGEVLTSLGRYDEARDELERAAEGYSILGDLEGVGVVTAQIGRLCFQQSRAAEGIERIRPVTARLDGRGPSAALAALKAVLASLHWVAGRYREQMGTAEAAVQMAREVGHGRVHAEAMVWKGVALVALQRTQEGIGVLEEAAVLAEAAGDLPSLCRALNTTAAAYQEQGEYHKQQPYLDRAVEIADRLGDPSRVAFMRYRRGWHAWMIGEWELARADLLQSVSISERGERSWITPYALYGLASLSFAAGDVATASHHAESCISMAEDGGDVRMTWAALSLLAQCDISEGRHRRARRRLRRALRGAGIATGDRVLLLTILAEAHLRLGELSKAEPTIEQALAEARSCHDTPTLIEALRIHGLVAGRSQHLEEARDSLDEALVLVESIPNPYAKARVLETWGAIESEHGDQSRAREQLQQAAEIFHRLGARRDAG
ncbi:MAG: hypothetical protein M3Z66_17560, partial [Chloroflexota bacterium]|nr:hypothetical protein [Chloroflexota bacterium]